jgi:hypothetical protein
MYSNWHGMQTNGATTCKQMAASIAMSASAHKMSA